MLAWFAMINGHGQKHQDGYPYFQDEYTDRIRDPRHKNWLY